VEVDRKGYLGFQSSFTRQYKLDWESTQSN
jgi:hypothetical protein